ncbi:MAG: ROK family protein [Propionibacteriaceae bacterium]|nr:ROK family protein [Propionibacteriaceae bacterium]
MSDAVLAVDLGGTKCLGVVADLDGVIVFEHRILVSEADGAKDALNRCCTALLQAAEKASLSPKSIIVGVPATVDPETALADIGPNVGWHGVNLAEDLAAFGLPFQVENDANLAALGERSLGLAQNVADFAVISMGTGLGGAVVSGGRLLRGAHHAAGEFAFLPRGVSDVRATASGATTADIAAADAAIASTATAPGTAIAGIAGLERVLTGPAIEAAAARIATSGNSTGRAGDTLPQDSSAVVRAAVEGQELAGRVLAEVVEALAACVLAICAVIDPALVVLDGSVGRALESFLPEVQRLIARRMPHPPRLEISKLKPTATICGAIGAALSLNAALTQDAALSQNGGAK